MDSSNTLYNGLIEVMFYDTDAGGVVHNIAYLRFVEYARTKLAAQLGHDIKTCADENIFAVVVRTEIDYIKPAKLGESLTITSTLSGADRVRFYITTEIFRPTDGKKIIRCYQTLALLKMPEGKVLPAPKDWVGFFSPKE